MVGTQINGAPHLGTNLVQTAAFLLAKIARREFSIDTCVRFGALDNAPHEVAVSDLIEGYYRAFFDSISQATDTDYAVETYTDQQASPGFRAEFLRTLYRNLVKERALSRKTSTLHVMMKGGNWASAASSATER